MLSREYKESAHRLLALLSGRRWLEALMYYSQLPLYLKMGVVTSAAYASPDSEIVRLFIAVAKLVETGYHEEYDRKKLYLFDEELSNDKRDTLVAVGPHVSMYTTVADPSCDEPDHELVDVKVYRDGAITGVDVDGENVPEEVVKLAYCSQEFYHPVNHSWKGAWYDCVIDKTSSVVKVVLYGFPSNEELQVMLQQDLMTYVYKLEEGAENDPPRMSNLLWVCECYPEDDGPNDKRLHIVEETECPQCGVQRRVSEKRTVVCNAGYGNPARYFYGMKGILSERLFFGSREDMIKVRAVADAVNEELWDYLNNQIDLGQYPPGVDAPDFLKPQKCV